MSKLLRIACVGMLGGAFLTGASLISVGSGPAAGPSATAAVVEHHAHIHAAIRELKEARKDLKEGAHDFGGHREDAVKAIDVAIEQLEVCLKHDKR
jgi:hypothetical protein